MHCTIRRRRILRFCCIWMASLKLLRFLLLFRFLPHSLSTIPQLGFPIPLSFLCFAFTRPVSIFSLAFNQSSTFFVSLLLLLVVVLFRIHLRSSYESDLSVNYFNSSYSSFSSLSHFPVSLVLNFLAPWCYV